LLWNVGAHVPNDVIPQKTSHNMKFQILYELCFLLSELLQVKLSVFVPSVANINICPQGSDFSVGGFNNCTYKLKMRHPVVLGIYDR
jgi:hypothetical protein